MSLDTVDPKKISGPHDAKVNASGQEGVATATGRTAQAVEPDRTTKATSEVSSKLESSDVAASSTVPLIKPVQGAHAIVLGRDSPFLVKIDSQKQWYHEPAVYLSAVAILFSIFSLWVNLHVGFTKDKRARRQSIEDEFFLRKVLYPLAIEPALEHYAKMLSTLPLDRFDPAATAKAVADFKSDFDKENSVIVAKVVTLGILGQALLNSVKLELEAIEDLVSEYCFENSLGYDPADSTNTNTRSSVESQVSGHLVTVLKAIKTFQESVR